MSKTHGKDWSGTSKQFGYYLQQRDTSVQHILVEITTLVTAVHSPPNVKYTQATRNRHIDGHFIFAWVSMQCFQYFTSETSVPWKCYIPRPPGCQVSQRIVVLCFPWVHPVSAHSNKTQHFHRLPELCAGCPHDEDSSACHIHIQYSMKFCHSAIFTEFNEKSIEEKPGKIEKTRKN